MFGCSGRERKGLRTASAVVALGVLTSCSYVPDALNPVEWYKGAEDLVTGSDRPQVASPVPARTEGGAAASEQPAVAAEAPSKAPAKGLVADRGNARYAQPVRREMAPTKPLARRAPPPETQTAAAAAPATAAAAAPATAVAAAPATAAPPVAVAPAATAQQPQAAPAPQVAEAGQPRLDPATRQPTARDTGPAAPPAMVDMTPPARPDIPETVPVPGQRLKPVQAHYQKRLAESASAVVRPDVVEMPGQAARAEEPIHLVPPTKVAKVRGSRGLDVPQPRLETGPAATFQVAAVDFQTGSAKLTRTDLANIAEVARLYRRSGGVVRVVGIAPGPGFSGDAVAQVMGGFDASMERAKAVAKELTRRGVPAHKIMIGADPTPAIRGGAGAKVFLDVI